METIKTINTIENVDLIKEITNVKKVDEISLIDNITSIGTLNLLDQINTINSINAIRQACFRPSLVLNGGFESGDLSNWKDLSSSVSVVTTYAFDGKYSAFLPTNMYGYLIQYVNIPSNIVDNVVCYWKSDV